MKDLKTASDKTPSGIPLQPAYGEGVGDYPYLRGIHPNMYRGRLWTMRQYAGFGTAEESNKRYHYLLSQGTTGLSVAFDLPTQMGYDSDHAMARGEVGRVGVAIDTIEDMEILFQGIDQTKVSTSMTINSTAAILLSLYIAVAERRGVDKNKITGTVQNDLLKEYIARGTYIYPPKASLKIITDMISFSKDHLPRWNPISISGYHIREAGSTAVQEVAFTLANGLVYVQAAIDQGMDVDSFAPRLSFFFNAHNHIFEEVAKFRVARKIWAEELKARYGTTNEKSLKLRFHAQTAGSMLTAQEPENNIVRITLQALAAVMGGAQSIHTNGFDEAMALPTEESARIALRTQQILAYESGAADVADPLGGSHFIESLSKELEEKVRQYFKEIEKRGGMVACIESGYIEKEIQDVAYQTQLSLEKKDQVQVGSNYFLSEEEADKSSSLLKMDLSLENKQVDRLTKFKSKRDKKYEKMLKKLEIATKAEENVMPHILNAVKVGVSLGEISNIFRDVFGTHTGRKG